MKKAYLLLIGILFFINSGRGEDFSLAKYDTVPSKIYSANRQILVHVPSGAKSGVRYPVMYLLDGESHLVKTLGILDFLSKTAGNELCPEMIVVAVVHRQREQELVPSKDPAQDQFARFLETELIPYIETKYKTTPYRTFIGHSLGGLRVINTLVYQPHLFNSYIALDPSLGHVPGWIHKTISDFEKTKYANHALYIAMGLTMPKGMDTAVIYADTSGRARHMRSIMMFANNAIQKPHANLDVHWKYYPEESHQSVVFRGTYDGLVSNFSWFENEHLYDIFDTSVSPAASVKVITDYYRRISLKLGYPILPPLQGTAELIDYLNFKKWYDKSLAFAQLNQTNYPSNQIAEAQLEEALWNVKQSIESLYPAKSIREISVICKRESQNKNKQFNISESAINAFGYKLLQLNKLNDAAMIFKLNIELYPGSYNVYDSYGECLLSLGKEKEAIDAYKKSYELNNRNTNAKNIIDKYNK